MKATKRKPKIERKRILIVDDHPMMREGLSQVIAQEPDLEICGEAGSAPEAIEKVIALQPHLVVTDITLPGRNGLELTKDIVATVPDTLILVLSMHDESLYGERVLRAGARGYVMKQEGGKRIMEAIRRVLAGHIAVSDTLSAKLLEIFSTPRSPHSVVPVEKLTDREFEVFQLIGRGMETKAIASEMSLSPKTVEVHRTNIKTKLKISSLSELIRYAVRWEEAHIEAEPQRGKRE